MSFAEAIIQNKPDLLRQILSGGYHPDTRVCGIPAIAHAALANRIALVRVLLDFHAHPNPTVGQEPLILLVIRSCDLEVARLLLRSGADPNAPDVNGYIYLPRNALRVIQNEGEENLVQRGYRLYDRVTRSYVFTASVTLAGLVLALPFEELPEPVRQFITVRAGRRFQDQYQGDQSLHQFKARDEMVAKAGLENFEAETAKHNVLTNSSLMTRIRGNR
jgi:hypothetical protein